MKTEQYKIWYSPGCNSGSRKKFCLKCQLSLAITQVPLPHAPCGLGGGDSWPFSEINKTYPKLFTFHHCMYLKCIPLRIQTIAIVYSCFKEDIVLRRRTTKPPPSTVSTVLAKRLGVRASKSFKGKIVGNEALDSTHLWAPINKILSTRHVLHVHLSWQIISVIINFKREIIVLLLLELAIYSQICLC